VARRSPRTRTTDHSSGSPASSGANRVNPVGCVVNPTPASRNASQASDSRCWRAAASTVSRVSDPASATMVSGRTPMSWGTHQARKVTASSALASTRVLRCPGAFGAAPSGNSVALVPGGAHSRMAPTITRRSANQVSTPKVSAGMRCSTTESPATCCHQPSAW
jgi:hypothetical protein